MLIAWGINQKAELQLEEFKNFNDLCLAIIRKCKPGIKNKAEYFIRGGDIKDHYRNDDNLLSSQLIIGDIDNTEIPPDIAHKILKAKKLSHFIYTTTSYTPEKPKYRIILPYDTANKDECKRATAYLDSILPGIDLARESYVWSQEWFVSVAESTDGWFHEENQLSIPADFIYKNNKQSNIKTLDEPNSDQMAYTDHLLAMFETGDCHNHYVPMCLSLANEGHNYKYIYERIQPLVKRAFRIHNREFNSDRDDRIKESILSALDKIKSEKPPNLSIVVPYINKNEIVHSKDYPPGLMGQMVKDFEKMSFYPNKQIAMAGSIGFIAGIIGRTYNINGMGLNIYITVLMRSGMGKDALSKNINKTLMNATPGGTAGRSFIGSSRYTGPKAIWNDMDTGKSKIATMTEAGIMNGSKAGDKENLERALLNFYTSSGYGNFMINEGYSNNKDSLKDIHSPALSVIQESTPEVFIRNLVSNDGDIRGDLARMWITRIEGDKPKINRNKSDKFSKEVINRINELVEECSVNQLSDIIKLNGDYKLTAHMLNVCDKYVDIENKAHRANESLKATMASRSFAKALKIGAIIDIFNGDDPSDTTFNWACKHIIDIELENINISFQYESSDDIMNVIKGTVAVTISRILNNKYNDLKKIPKKELREKGIFTRSNLYQCLRNNKVIKALHTRTGSIKAKHGIDVVLEYMSEHHLLNKMDEKAMQTVVGKESVFGIGYKVTKEFLMLIKAK